MKLLTIIGMATVTLASSKAATINVSGGFGTGVLVATTLGTTSNVASTLEVGNFAGNLFTPFVAPAVNLGAGAKIAGQFIGSGPTTLNSLPIFLRVTTAQGFAILSTANNFPAAVDNALLSQTVSFTSSSSGNVVAFGGAEVTGVSFTTPNQLSFNVVPEPSAALLGAFGALGLLRRRRN
jgi:hypothetical protein